MTRGSEGQPPPHLALTACYLDDSGDLWGKLGPLTPDAHTPGSGAGRATGPSAAACRPAEPVTACELSPPLPYVTLTPLVPSKSCTRFSCGRPSPRTLRGRKFWEA